MAKDDTAHIKTKKVVKHGGGSGGIWFVGFIGMLIYFLHVHSGTLWLVALAFFKAIFWPAFLVYYLLRFMHI